MGSEEKVISHNTQQLPTTDSRFIDRNNIWVLT